MTRERDRNRLWADQLQAAGLAFSLLPLVRYAPLPLPASREFTTFAWILFTSPQAVNAFTALRPEIGAAQIAVLGHGTAAAVKEAGWPVALNAGALDGAAFVQQFLTTAGKPCSVLLPGPKRRLSEPRASLDAAGYHVRELPLYETLPVAPETISAAELRPTDVVFFCSPSAVRAFAGARDDRPQCVVIGNTTAIACRDAGFDPAVADSPDLEAMVRAAGLSGPPESTSEPVKPEMET